MADTDPFVPTTDKSGEGVDTGNVSASEYESKGDTVVVTPSGYEFAPQDKKIPHVTPQGITVTKTTAEALVKESDGLVRIKEGSDE